MGAGEKTQDDGTKKPLIQCGISGFSMGICGPLFL